MDDGLFDVLTRSVVSDAGTRRAALRLLAGGACGAVAGRLGFHDAADAKRKRKKKKKNTQTCGGSSPIQCPPPVGAPDEICYPAGTHCCGSALGGGACYVGHDCCPPSVAYPGGSCALEDEVCCSAAAGGGSCPLSSPICCPPNLLEPEGSCIPTGNTCCSFGGYCAANETCCPPSPAYPYGSCALPGRSCGQFLDAPSAERSLSPVRRTEAVSRAGRRRLPADGRDEPERRGRSADTPAATGGRPAEIDS